MGHASYHPKGDKHFVVIRVLGNEDRSIAFKTADSAYLFIEKYNKRVQS